MNQHKDLPSGSQSWAKEVDALMATVKRQEELIRRLCANAGLDYANPQRGINSGDTPSAKNPVGQKLSSLADTQIYDVADGQVLTWKQKDQRWLPVTPTTGGTIDISAVSYSGLTEGYGVVTSPSAYAYTAAGVIANEFGPDYYNVETWSTGTTYYGAGNGLGVALITLDVDGFGRPSVDLHCEDYGDGTSSSLEVFSYGIRVASDLFKPPTTLTANRPTPSGLGAVGDPGCQSYDLDLDIPIWWNGTQWTNALGTAV